MHFYREPDTDGVLKTPERFRRRIDERFPGAVWRKLIIMQTDVRAADAAAEDPSAVLHKAEQ
jgi:hypothetical protein